MPPRSEPDPEGRRRRIREGLAVKRRLAALVESRPELRAFLEGNVAEWGGGPVSERRVELLDQLIGEQAYLLSYWRVAPEEIDYRRFFDIADLVALRQQGPEVFEATHAFVLELVRSGKVTGLRIDHVDGLHDPESYLLRLREHVGGRCYVVVEKILAEGEGLPEVWPVAGTTGYDFLNVVTGLFVEPEGAAALARAWARFTGDDRPFAELAREAKRQAMGELFGSEVQALAARLQRLARQDRRGRDLTRSELTRALVEVTARLPVYRTYVRDRNVPAADRSRMVDAVRRAEGELPVEAATALDFLRRVLLLELPRRSPRERLQSWLGFVMRWQQLTGAVMAKGHEDTAMYVYNPLASRNDVGGDPGRAPASPAEFHRANRSRLRAWPHALSPMSTHDTKRSEDVRARIDVLSEMADEWAERQIRWTRWNHSKKREVAGHLAPDPSDELLLYQTLVGVWPVTKREERGLTARLQEYMLKAVREAKSHTSWVDPNPEYEGAVASFVHAVMAPSNRRFRKELVDVVRRVAFHGSINSVTGPAQGGLAGSARPLSGDGDVEPQARGSGQPAAPGFSPPGQGARCSGTLRHTRRVPPYVAGRPGEVAGDQPSTDPSSDESGAIRRGHVPSPVRIRPVEPTRGGVLQATAPKLGRGSRASIHAAAGRAGDPAGRSRRMGHGRDRSSGASPSALGQRADGGTPPFAGTTGLTRTRAGRGLRHVPCRLTLA